MISKKVKTPTPGNMEPDSNDINKDYDMCPKPQVQMDVQDSTNFEKLNKHIVVCGINSSINHFILPLRAKYLETKQ